MMWIEGQEEERCGRRVGRKDERRRKRNEEEEGWR